MSDTNKTYWTDDDELVEKYVLGQLSDEERLRLDAEIADCEPCKRKLRHELEMAAGIRRYGRDSLKAKLHSKLQKKYAGQIQQFHFVGLAAAVIIIALGIGVYQIWFSDLVSPKTFGSKKIVLVQPEQSQATVRGDDTQKSGEEINKDAEKDKSNESVAASTGNVGKETRTKAASTTAKKKKDKSASAVALADESAAVEKLPGVSAEKAAAVSSTELKKVESKPSRIYKEQTVWLLGKVEIVSDGAAQHAAKAASQKTPPEQFLAREETVQRKLSRQQLSQSRIITVKRSGEEKQIVLQQRSFRELPPKRQTQLGKESHVETLLEQSKTGSLNLTIFSDSFSEDDLENATVETVNDDSLIISTANQRIYYRLPEGLSTQQKSRR